MISLQIKDHCHGLSFKERQIDDDIVFDDVSHFNFSKWYGFYPLWKVIGYREDEPMTSSRWRIDNSYDVGSPGFKGH